MIGQVADVDATNVTESAAIEVHVEAVVVEIAHEVDNDNGPRGKSDVKDWMTTKPGMMVMPI